MRKLRTAALILTVLLPSACGKRDTQARNRAIEAALTPFSQIDIPTGSHLNVGREAISGFRRLEAAGLIRIQDVPQGYWDNFATQTYMEGAKPYKIVPTQKLNEIALNPRWSTPSHTVDLSRETVAGTLEPSWNFYVREKIFLGTNCFGGATSFARSDGPCALELISEYPTYLALAAKGLISLDETEVPPSAVPSSLSNVRIERAARVTLTPSGTHVADVDGKANTATFVFGTYRLEEISKNIPIAASDGIYRLVEGTHVFDLRPEFKDLWAQLGKPAYRERRFRTVFTHDTKSGKWQVAISSNGRSSAEDVGPRNGEFESANVPPTVDELPLKGKNERRDDGYTWHVRLGDLKVGEVLRDEDYKGPLASPGESFRLVLAKIQVLPVGKTSLPTELTQMLPGRLRSVLKYSDFKKEWNVVALDVAPADSEQWSSSNVR